MRMRRISFATLHGFDVQTLNDPRYSQTIYLWISYFSTYDFGFFLFDY